MPIPRVTCSADVSIGVAATSGGYVMNLSATATNGPITEYRWTILFVPTGGSAALNSGDFTAGVAVGQNVSFTAPDGVVGTYVVQCVAQNASGYSNPYLDGEAGQQNLIVADADGVQFPGDFQFNYGALLRTVIATLKSLGGTDELVKVSGTDTAGDYLSAKLLPQAGIQAILDSGPPELLYIQPVYGSGASQVCEGNDARLSDARTPTGGAGGQLGGTYPNPDVRGLRETAGPTLLTLGAVADGEVLTRSGATIVGSTPTAGFSAREQEFVAVGGTETFTLAATPPVNANTTSGRNILGVYRNGMRLRWRMAASTALEWDQPNPNEVRIPALTASDIITVVYGD